MWGYDAGNKKLVAYQLRSTGVSTKSVDGWVGGKFQSRRDDNGATVTIVPIGKNAFNWVIESAEPAQTWSQKRALAEPRLGLA